MSSFELVMLVSALASSIAKAYTKEETALLSAVFSQLGDTLATIAASDNINSVQKDKDDSSE
jgi:hypothetical protein